MIPTGEKLEQSEAAEFMNDYFTNIGEELNQVNNTVWSAHSLFQELLSSSFMLKGTNTHPNGHYGSKFCHLN